MPGNKKKIGFFHATPFDTAVQANFWLDVKPDWLTRQVRIFQKNTSLMHNVPVMHDGYRWCIQWERQAVYKTPWMGWTFVSDDQSKRLLKFKRLETAIAYCREMGLSYEVAYPHFRPHTKKNYGDNFKWKGQPKTEVDDI